MEHISATAKHFLSSDSFQHDSEHHNEEVDRKLTKHQFDHQFKKLVQKNEKAKNNLVFWSGLTEGRFESIAGIINLFILLLILTLGSSTYNGVGTTEGINLGWISVAQVIFIYILVIVVKAFYLPVLERQLQQSKTQGFTLYSQIYSGKRQVSKMQIGELQLLAQTIQERFDQLKHLASKKQISQLSNQIQINLKSRSKHPYRFNIQIQIIKTKETQAKYWQNFWQQFILGKTFSLPGVLLLLFIITSVSNAKIDSTSVAMNNAQGWIPIGFWSLSILVFIVIKACLWDYLNQKVQNAKSAPFIAFKPIYFGNKQLKSLNLKQLGQLQNVLNKRQIELQACFPQIDIKELFQQVQKILTERLPLKTSEQQQIPIKEITNKQNKIKSYYAAWLSFFNARLIACIINALKFLIVMSLTFGRNYPQTAALVDSAQKAIGSIGICVFVFGYLFYFILRCWILQKLQDNVKQASAQPFLTFRLEYFGNKEQKDLKIHQLQSIHNVILKRREQFMHCFPKIQYDVVETQIQQLIREKMDQIKHIQSIKNLLVQQNNSKSRLAFWTTFSDTPLLTASYSIYVLLVLLIETLVRGNSGAASALGWVGVAVLATFIVIYTLFKCYILQRIAEITKTLKVQGFSEYYQAYTKTKQLKDVALSQLLKIQQIIETNPIQFGRCFPNANLQSALSSVKQLIKLKNKALFKVQSQIIQATVDHQILTQQLNRYKNLLAIWSSLIKEKLYAMMPIMIVSFILWAQTIATTLYGITVCGFLTVSFLIIIVFIILFFNLWYRGSLQRKIQSIENSIQHLETQILHN